MAYTALIDQSHGRRKHTLEACGLAIFLGVCLVALAAYPAFLAGQLTQSLPGGRDMSSGFVAIWLGCGLVLFCLFSLEKLFAAGPAIRRHRVRRWRHPDGRGNLGVIFVGLAQACSRFDPFIPIVPALVHRPSHRSAPIAGILALAGLLYFVITGEAPITTVPSALQYGVPASCCWPYRSSWWPAR